MTKYVCLLRGINVGGNALIKMSELKTVFEKAGFTNVSTYINSGNVLFASEETSREKLTSLIEKTISKAFSMDLRVVVHSHSELKHVVAEAPNVWKTDKFRCYLAFLKEPTTSADVLKEVKLTAGVDFAKAGKHVLYIWTTLEGITKSGFTKLVGKPIYKQLTMRNLNTTKKLLELMEK